MPLFRDLHKKPVYAVCNVSVAPIRREPKHTAEQGSQLLFGERLEILEHNETTDWARVRCAWDGYEAWCKMGQLRTISNKDYQKKERVLSNTHFGSMRTGKTDMWLPRGSELGGHKKYLHREGDDPVKFRGKKLDPGKSHRSTAGLLEAARSYMHAPYQWGGRTIAGIDCSGLVQMAFKYFSIPILRDAADQATMGEEVHFLAEAQAGDLAFFNNAEGRITHVGILADKHTIIHATDTAGRVVEDRIDPAGIISVSLKKRTHNLRMLRRIAL